MDTTDPDILFDADGVCNHCHNAKENLPYYHFTLKQEEENIQNLKAVVKKRQKSDYDSIIGLSGGVDSSYVAYLAMKMGLNPLCVHFDNGWDSSVAVKNIHRIIDVTGFDLYTYVVNWSEFKDLQRSFIKSGVIDIEMLTDHGISVSIRRICKDKKITTILSGGNYLTEHGMPKAWAWPKMDGRNIKSIHNKYGRISPKPFPIVSNFSWMFGKYINFSCVSKFPLNMINYRKTDAMQKLESAFQWQYYGGKHYESIFTKFYQAYMLPLKFSVDKRKPHLSALIRNHEITRSEAINELNKPLYDKKELVRDSAFVLKKLGFTRSEFDTLMHQTPVPHDYYATDRVLLELLTSIGKAIFRK